jgi:hypothetical protein
MSDQDNMIYSKVIQLILKLKGQCDPLFLEEDLQISMLLKMLMNML